MNKRQLKDLFEKYYTQSLNSFGNDCSAIIVVESVKSIIGINLDKNSDNLMLWLHNYMRNYKDEKFKFSDNSENLPEVISYKNLEFSIISKDIEKSYRNISYLSNVSDGTQIMEFLLELSLKYSFGAFPLIWSVYRMEMFLSRKLLSNSLQVCIKALIDRLSDEIIINNKEVKWKQLLRHHKDIVPLYYNVYKTELIRSEKINELILSNLNIYKRTSNKDYEYKVLKDQKIMGREWILDYFNNMDIGNINSQLIIKANNIRSCLKSASDNKEKLILWTELNRCIDAAE